MMASAGKLSIHVTARVNVAPVANANTATTWHDDGLRCRIAQHVYRFATRLARIADRIDRPERHPL